jgi:hypothetical protein
MLASPPTSAGKLAMAPLLSLRRSEAAACAPIERRFSSPPSTFVPPRPSLSLVASTAPPASASASNRAMSWRGLVGSVNWTS